MRLVLAGVRTGEETFRKAPLIVRKGYMYSRKGAVAVRKAPLMVRKCFI